MKQRSKQRERVRCLNSYAGEARLQFGELPFYTPCLNLPDIKQWRRGVLSGVASAGFFTLLRQLACIVAKLIQRRLPNQLPKRFGNRIEGSVLIKRRGGSLDPGVRRSRDLLTKLLYKAGFPD